jgi:predicted dienelactone hydrolase
MKSYRGVKCCWLLVVGSWLLVALPLSSLGQSYSVGEKTIEYSDSSRKRPVKCEIWYPTYDRLQAAGETTDLPFILQPTIRDAGFTDHKCPLILISHGTGGNRFSLAWLAIPLAEKGYIVVAPDHWGNTFDNKIPEYFVRYWERPTDISFLLSQLLDDKIIGHLIKSDKIGIIGFSFGGYTSLALAGADIDCNLLQEKIKTPSGKKEFNIPEYGDLTKMIGQISCDSVQKTFKDSRIRAFVALSPALGSGFDRSEQTSSIDSPVLIIASENDKITPVGTNAGNYHLLIKGSQYILLGGKAGHYVFLNEADEELKKEAKRYYKDSRTINRSMIHRKVENEISLFFEKSFMM